MLFRSVSKTTPVGLPEYLPSKETLAAARRLSKSFAWKKRAYRKFNIHGLYLMGSTGTIAYSEKSDFDIWVVHDSELDSKQIEELQARARDRKSTRLNSSHTDISRMPSSA